MSAVRDGVNGCRCCGFRLVDADGWCETCIGRRHHLQPAPLPTRHVRASPRDRQIRHPGRDR